MEIRYNPVSETLTETVIETATGTVIETAIETGETNA